MDAAGREMQVRAFVEEVWNGRDYQAVSDLYGDRVIREWTGADKFGLFI